MFLFFPYDEEFYFDSDHIDKTSGIEDLGFRVNDYNYLRSLGFSTVGQLLEKDGWYYFNLPRHSLRKFERFIRRLDTLGFRVKDASAEQYPNLEQMSYRKSLWAHRPLTDFWRVGSGYAKKLEANGMFTMGDVARRSVTDEGTLYKLFGINAELLIDHAWGWEPCTIAEIKAYKPSTNSISSGQVLHCPYSFEKAKLITREMVDMLALDLVDKGLVTDQIVLTIGFDIENLRDPSMRRQYHGAVTTDHYGREVPKHAYGTGNLGRHTSSTKRIMEAASELFDSIVDKNLLIRRINVTANHVIDEAAVPKEPEAEQLDLFTDYAETEARRKAEAAELERERTMQLAMLTIKKRYGKNAILKGMNFEEGATAKGRNSQIGGHKA